MSTQPEEWDDMDVQTQQEIRDRLHAAIADVERVDLRARLARASRSGLAARLGHTETA